MSKAMYMPFNYGSIDLATDGSNTFWKKLLPLNGEINYDGRKLRFTKYMLQNIVDSFRNKAYDQIPFQLATDRNEHNYDPERSRGEVADLRVTDDGLMGLFKLTNDGAKLIENNNNLGVSVSVKRNYERADGKKFPYALQHVLGTIDPKVTGLGPWKVAELSNSEPNEEVEDLTTADVTDSKTDESVTKEETEATMVSVPKEEWEEFRDYIKSLKKTDEELNSLLDSGSNDSGERETVDASNKPSAEFIELSNRVASAEFERYADSLKRDGVPPAMIDSARKILGSSELVELSNDGGDRDPRSVIKEILEQAKGTIDLSADIGHSQSVDEQTEEEKRIVAELDKLFQ